MRKKVILAVAFGFCLFGCASQMYGPFYRQATSGPEYITSVHWDLLNLPGPERPVPVAVYRFRDQTGQYKPPTTASNFSTAVTQGATSILIKALEDSGWFIPVERENLSDLLQERKLILQTSQQYEDEALKESSLKMLQPLVYAGVIFTGGIIGYDSNIVTGGLGLRYFGAGGSGQYRVDRVSVYLRAISVKNGAILKTVQATKVILSQQIGGGIFRFVRLNRLLEAEVGVACNEPVEMAVQEAIEKAVYDMIVEGVKMGLWKPKDPEAFKAIVDRYEQERKAALKRFMEKEKEFWGEG